jgi:hypothetical protein
MKARDDGSLDSVASRLTSSEGVMNRIRNRGFGAPVRIVQPRFYRLRSP